MATCCPTRMAGAGISISRRHGPLVLTGLVYAILGFVDRPFPEATCFPRPADRTWAAFGGVIAKHIRLAAAGRRRSRSYNVLQRATYLLVIFVLFPLVIWTGLAMSPGFNAAVSGDGQCAGRAAIRAHAAFLRLRISLALSYCPHRDGCSGRILEPHAGDDHRRPTAAPEERT